MNLSAVCLKLGAKVFIKQVFNAYLLNQIAGWGGGDFEKCIYKCELNYQI